MKGVALSTMQLEDHLQTLMVLCHRPLCNMKLMFLNEAVMMIVISLKHIHCVCFRPRCFILQIASVLLSIKIFNWFLKTFDCFT